MFYNIKPMSFLCNWICCQGQSNLDRSTIDIQVVDAVPIKVKNSQYYQIVERCKKSYQCFVDKEFPPQNQSLGQFNNVGRAIGWKRVVDIVPDCCLFDPRRSMSSSIIASATSDSYITASLISLAFTPQKIYDIFRKVNETSIEGIYQILVKRNGIIECIIIDDYIPIFQDTGRPLLCGSINRQIWVMLLYKAWAKICGSYSAIQEADCLDFLNAFSVAPCFSYFLHPSIADDNELLEEISRVLVKPDYTLCVITSANPKNGLLGDYHYALRGLSGEKAVQMVTGSGGKQTYLRLSIQQMLQNCVELIVSKFDKKMTNGDTQKYKITYNQPFFIKMTLKDEYNLDLLLKRGKNIQRNAFFRAVLSKQQKDGSYTYVSSKLESYYNDLVLIAHNLAEGNYSIMVLIQGQPNNQVQISVSCYYKLEGQIASPKFVQEVKSKNDYLTFLKTSLTDYAKKSQKCVKQELALSKSVMFVQQLYRNGGLGYLLIKPSNLLKSLKVIFNLKQIQSSQYKLLNKLTQDTLMLQPEQEAIFIFLLRETLNNSVSQEKSFPPGISLVQIF